MTGALVQWLRDTLRIIRASADVETLAASVPDNGDAYFVPAFSDLYAPYWRSDARGVIAGLTRYATAGQIARAALEATAYRRSMSCVQWSRMRVLRSGRCGWMAGWWRTIC